MLNPLSPVTDYQSMLNRISWFTTASALGAIWLLRRHVEPVDVFLGQIDSVLTVEGSKALAIRGGYLAPALALGVAARVFRLHAKISDWLGIREYFDVEVIIRGFAERLDIDLEQTPAGEIVRARHHIMRKAFYPFVSGSQPSIDRQLVQQALDAWSWFWVGVEATLIFTLTGLGLIACNAYEAGFQTLGCALGAAVLVLPTLYRQCRLFAMAQVRAILDDPAREAVVRSVLMPNAAERIRPRLAA